MKTVALIICAAALVGGGLLSVIYSNEQASTAVSSDLLNLPVESTRIVVSKSARRMRLYSGDRLLRTYRVGLGFSPVKDKVKEGDGATPEGEFYIFTKNPQSDYFLSLGISYPNIEDAERGLRTRLISQAQYRQIVEANRNHTMPPQDTPLGGLIYIHGNGANKDWTWGCVALDDKEMKELFDAVQVGMRVIIEH